MKRPMPVESMCVTPLKSNTRFLRPFCNNSGISVASCEPSWPTINAPRSVITLVVPVRSWCSTGICGKDEFTLNVGKKADVHARDMRHKTVHFGCCRGRPRLSDLSMCVFSRSGSNRISRGALESLDGRQQAPASRCLEEIEGSGGKACDRRSSPDRNWYGRETAGRTESES